MRRAAPQAALLVALLAMAGPVAAQVVPLETEPATSLVTTPVSAVSPAPPAASETPLLADPARLLPLDGQPTATAPAPTLAFEYSEGYRQRARVHKIASFATLPIFGAEAIVGQSLYSNPTQGKKDAHLVIAGALGALFAVNTVTGVWNLLEARKDPHFGKRKWAHALMMLGADAGFVATAALGPGEGSSDGRAAHRAVAFTAIGLATTSYLIMLFGN